MRVDAGYRQKVLSASLSRGAMLSLALTQTLTRPGPSVGEIWFHFPNLLRDDKSCWTLPGLNEQQFAVEHRLDVVGNVRAVITGLRSLWSHIRTALPRPQGPSLLSRVVPTVEIDAKSVQRSTEQRGYNVWESNQAGAFCVKIWFA